MTNTKKAIICAIMIAICVVLPMAFHAIPSAGIHPDDDAGIRRGCRLPLHPPERPQGKAFPMGTIAQKQTVFAVCFFTPAPPKKRMERPQASGRADIW